MGLTRWVLQRSCSSRALQTRRSVSRSQGWQVAGIFTVVAAAAARLALFFFAVQFERMSRWGQEGNEMQGGTSARVPSIHRLCFESKQGRVAGRWPVERKQAEPKVANWEVRYGSRGALTSGSNDAEKWQEEGTEAEEGGVGFSGWSGVFTLSVIALLLLGRLVGCWSLLPTHFLLVAAARGVGWALDSGHQRRQHIVSELPFIVARSGVLADQPWGGDEEVGESEVQRV